MRFSANRGCGATSSSPPWPIAQTSGVPEIAVGSSVPLRTMRSRPTFSVTSMSPFGRKAMLHGSARPFT